MADGTYPAPELPEDRGELSVRIFEVLQQHMPGFVPDPAAPGTWHLEAVAVAHEATVQALQRWSAYTFARLGEIDGAPLRQGSPARVASTWTFIDTVGHTVRRGTPVRLLAANGEIEMVVVADVTVPPGQSATAPGGVELETIEVGAAFNDQTGTLVLDEAMAEVEADGIAIVGLTAGGADIEDPDSYLDRLTRRRRLQTPRPVRAEEFAVFALEEPDVGRVTVLDLYNPDTLATDARATSTLFVASVPGEPLIAGRRAQIQAALLDRVEFNYDVFVEDYDYSTIDVTAKIVPLRGYDPDVVANRVADAIRAHLFPGSHGIPPFGDRAFAARPQTSVGYLDLAADAGAADGLDRLTELTIGLGGGAQAAADVAMSGPAPLPRPGNIVVTIA